MYLSHFGLRDQPFSIAPDPGYLYLSRRHQEALGHLLYGAGQGGGFVALTGEVGTGKTTLVRTLLEQKLAEVDIALCLNPNLTVSEFVATICDELGVSYPEGASLKQLTDNLNKQLLESHAQGRRSVVIIDEAQNLSREVLEQVRLLTNLETSREKLLRIILVGQPELQELLQRNDLRQLSQRITARYHLGELNKVETLAYMRHRLTIAGGHGELFLLAALQAVYKHSAGTPRLINVLSDRALAAAYSQGQPVVSKAHVAAAAKELQIIQSTSPASAKRVQGLAMVACCVTLVVAVWQLGGDWFVQEWQNLRGQGQDIQVSAEPVFEFSTPAAVLAPAPSVPAVELVTPVAAPVAAEPMDVAQPQPDFIEDLFTYGLARDELVSRWNAEGENLQTVTEREFCQLMTRQGLRCLGGQASVAELREYNRPVLLKWSRTGEVVEVLLQAVQGNDALLAGPEGIVKLPLSDLQRYWTGEYQLLLRMPAPGVFTLRQGQQGQAVVWLRQQLSYFDNDVTVSGAPEIYDDALLERLQRFQSHHRLEADGVAGGQTLTLLHNLNPAAGTPLLVLDEG